jgi:hypothetical protein
MVGRAVQLPAQAEYNLSQLAARTLKNVETSVDFFIGPCFNRFWLGFFH